MLRILINQCYFWVTINFPSFLFQLIFQGGFYHLRIRMKFLWSGVTWDVSVFRLCSVSLGGLRKLTVWMKALWFSSLVGCWPVVAMVVAFSWCFLYPCGLHKSIIWMKYLWVFILACMSWYLYDQFRKNNSDDVSRGFNASANVFEVGVC